MLVQKLRLQRGWSQQQLAELSGLSVRTVQRIEQGNSASPESLKSLAAVFEIDFSELNSEHSMTNFANPNPTAEPTLRNKSAIDEELAFRHVRKVKRFYINLALYVIVMTALAIINIVFTPNKLWYIWPALGWGLGLLFRATKLFEWIPFFGADWEKKQVEKRLGRLL